MDDVDGHEGKSYLTRGGVILLFPFASRHYIRVRGNSEESPIVSVFNYTINCMNIFMFASA